MWANREEPPREILARSAGTRSDRSSRPRYFTTSPKGPGRRSAGGRARAGSEAHAIFEPVHPWPLRAGGLEPSIDRQAAVPQRIDDVIEPVAVGAVAALSCLT